MDTLAATNGHHDIDEETLKQAQDWLDDATLVNLEEIAPEPVRVRIAHYVEEERADEDGVTRKHRTLKSRVATIEKYVPMVVYNRMLRTMGKMQRDKETGNAEWLAFVSEQVLSVWKLSEPDMTAEELAEGLDLKKQQKLFDVFFGDLLREGQKKRLKQQLP